MKTNEFLKLISTLLIVVMVGNMVLLPASVQAQPAMAVHPAAARVVGGGDIFMDAAPQALGHALQLAQLLDYISQVELKDLSENTLLQARQHALETAQQAATAQGSIGAMADGLAEMDLQHLQPAANMNDLVADLSANGFETELETALADAGLTSDQITSLETEAVNNYTVRRTSLPTETTSILLGAGLTSAQIEQIEQGLTDYGLADTTLPDRLAQLRASQEEMSAVRTEALVAYIQLLTQQVFLRQISGQASRAITPADTEALVQDQLRLLIHVAYLDHLWNGAPDRDIGEGQWLFVERYSLRVAERLDTLILETQNVGLVVDLLVALQIHSTALAALAGDAPYAKAEVDPLADLLATLVGDSLPGSQAARQAAPPFWWGAALALENLNPAAMYEPPLETGAVAVAQEQAQGRVAGLASPLWFPASQGQIPETDETNNVAQAVFHTRPPDMPPGVLDLLETQVLQGATPIEFVWEVLTGQSENWWAIGANMVISFLPIAGEVLDLIALFTDPSIWGKAMALIGLVASLCSDLTEVVTAIGVVIPPALLAGVAAAGSEGVDIGAAILRHIDHLKRLVGPTADLIKNVHFHSIGEALKLGMDFLLQLTRRALKTAGSWPGSLSEAIGLVERVLRSVWDPFAGLLRRYGNRLDDLLRLGFGDGGYLVGRVLQRGVELSDEAINTLAKIGDDLAKAGMELSDEAVGGLGKLAKSLPEEDIQRLVKNLCPGGLAQMRNYRVPGLASPLPANTCSVNFQKIFENVFNHWDEAALDGFKKLYKPGLDGSLSKILETYVDNPQLLNQGFGIFSKINFAGKWTPNEEAMKAVLGFIKKDGDAEYAEALLGRMVDAIHPTSGKKLLNEQVTGILTKLDSDDVLRELTVPNDPLIGNNIIAKLKIIYNPKSSPDAINGWKFQIQQAKY